ncbi:MAG TPA: hypothetical protein VJN67_23340 [Stellaceae bacterium]|nr:hypothetical protein [Stellaceae bacterium]
MPPTDRKEAETRLRELQDELAPVARLTEMGRMVTTLAHELPQPLTAASNYLEALRVMLERGDAAALDRAKSTADDAQMLDNPLTAVVRVPHYAVICHRLHPGALSRCLSRLAVAQSSA